MTVDNDYIVASINGVADEISELRELLQKIFSYYRNMTEVATKLSIDAIDQSMDKDFSEEKLREFMATLTGELFGGGSDDDS